ncbi:xanthine dehydrogenase family protein molybdopterin-binding subunit [Streptomyces sp. NPDC059740]|uniref:xanthine dehydrogenase family protein molybdopterin-binding subunit n=1 Tax=Streptomyces sp. NPDC059740 TaxID=3346926 RepID=UPI0036614E16
MTATTPRATGRDLARLEGREKVTGAARYAGDHVPAGLAYAWPVPATVPHGLVTAVAVDEALEDPAVLAVLTHEDAPGLGTVDDATLLVLQSPQVAHSGQVVALVVATSLEAARQGARAVRVDYERLPHDVVLRGDHPDLYAPETVNGGYPGTREQGDVAGALAAAAVRHEAEYGTVPLHNHPMEPHTAIAWWEDGSLRVHDSSQCANIVQGDLAKLFGLDREQVTVTSEHVGGGFGNKGTTRPHVVLAAMAARAVGRPVRLALARQQLPTLTGHRAPTRQRLRLGADADGRIVALAHEVTTQSSRLNEFTEQAAVVSRVMYRAPAALTSHRLARLDVPTPSWMRAPGECPGMFALESAMDELALACGVDPVELRIRNEPETEPDSGLPFSSRGVVTCLREGARRFGWAERDPAVGTRRKGRFLVGTGVACSTYPAMLQPCRARARSLPDGGVEVGIDATDLGTGARTVLTQIAAEAAGVPVEQVVVRIGCSALPRASVAGGSSGTASWGTAVHRACERLRELVAERRGTSAAGLEVEVDTAEEVQGRREFARHAFGAQFAEVRVDSVTGETRVSRMLGVFAAGRVLNPRTARSQFRGGMTMGLGMALTEGSTMDREFGDFAERDLAMYHVPVNADVPEIEVHWVEELDADLNPMGSKGIGEIGIVGAAAAVANAVHHATGIRVRTLPITPDVLLPHL